MVSISRFTHSYDLDGAVALYHSLRMKPVYLSKNAFGSLQAWLASSFCDRIENAPEEIRQKFKNLSNIKFLLRHKMRMIRFLALLDRRFLLQRSMFVI